MYLRCLSLHSPSDQKKKNSESYILETEIFWWIKERRYGACKIKPKKESTEISKFTD